VEWIFDLGANSLLTVQANNKLSQARRMESP